MFCLYLTLRFPSHVQCSYGKPPVSHCRTSVLWSAMLEVCAPDSQSLDLHFDAPLRFDSSSQLAALAAWPRPMVPSPEADGAIGEDEMATVVSAYSVSTDLYKISNQIVVELFRVGKKRSLATSIFEVRIVPERGSVAGGARQAQPPQQMFTPRRPLSDLSNQNQHQRYVYLPACWKIKPAPTQHILTQHIRYRAATSGSSKRPPLAPNSFIAAVKKILTPVAKLAVPRVTAHALSRGSAAVLMDRQRDGGWVRANRTNTLSKTTLHTSTTNVVSYSIHTCLHRLHLCWLPSESITTAEHFA